VVLEQNSPIVNTGDKLVLFDTGMGHLEDVRSDHARQQKSMAEAGIKPEDIDAVVLSHAHIDHIGGIVDSATRSCSPMAQFYIAQSDFDFWTDGSKMSGPLKIRGSRPEELLPSARRLVFFKDWPGNPARHQAMAAPGHTVGHHIFMVTRKKVVRLPRRSNHHAILLLEKPRMEFSYIPIRQQAANTASRVLDMVAANKTRSCPITFAWPGYGTSSRPARASTISPSRW